MTEATLTALDRADSHYLWFCKVTANAELMNAEPLLLGEIQGLVPESLWSRFCQAINREACFMCVGVYRHLI